MCCVCVFFFCISEHNICRGAKETEEKGHQDYFRGGRNYQTPAGSFSRIHREVYDNFVVGCHSRFSSLLNNSTVRCIGLTMAMGKSFRVYEKIKQKQASPHSLLLEHRNHKETVLFESQAVAVLCKYLTKKYKKEKEKKTLMRTNLKTILCFPRVTKLFSPGTILYTCFTCYIPGRECKYFDLPYLYTTSTSSDH